MVQPARRLATAQAANPLARRSHLGSLGADGESEGGRDHQQGRHDRYEQGHGCSSFVRDICSPSTQGTPFQVRSDRRRHRR